MTQSILYLARVHTDNVNPLLKEALILSKSLDSQGTYSWFTFVFFQDFEVFHQFDF
jgi:hypothetical protein